MTLTKLHWFVLPFFFTALIFVSPQLKAFETLPPTVFSFTSVPPKKTSNSSSMSLCHKALSTIAPVDTNPPKTSYSLALWNLHKGKTDGYQKDLHRILNNYDFLLGQELYLDQAHQELIEERQIHFSYGPSFRWGRFWTGVGNFSKYPAQFSTPLVSRGKEPILKTPKTSLINLYLLPGEVIPLMVVNVHALNFEISHQKFAQQIEDVVQSIRLHKGPLIVAGDFNTWSQARYQALLNLLKPLGVERLPISSPVGITHRTLDHIFVRNLQVKDYGLIPHITGSDHAALYLNFSL